MARALQAESDRVGALGRSGWRGQMQQLPGMAALEWELDWDGNEAAESSRRL
jgi:hypothetical protein